MIYHVKTMHPKDVRLGTGAVVADGGDKSLGYPLTEKLIETENFSAINKSFSEAYHNLEKILKDRDAGLKKQKDARKALRAYELTTDLVKHLLEVKREIIKRKAGEPKPK